MPILHGQAHWPGVVGVLSCSYTISHGIGASRAMLTTLPQATPPALQGSLVLTDNNVTIIVPDCKVDRLESHRDGSGITWSLFILDRRWRWQETAAVAGYYNQPDPHGLLLPWTIRTPQQLCALCLEAMGELGYDVSLVPNTWFPPVNWDYTNPAQNLSQLAEQLGCRVIYDLGNDRVRVVPLGVGAATLPDGSIYTESPTLDSPERPDSIVLVGAPVRFQARFKLEAVGKDWDGLYRPLGALSYVPALGWGTVGPPVFAGLRATDRLTKLQAIALAQESVYKCYQLVNLDPDRSGNPLTIPGYGRILRRQQVILQDTKAEQIQPNPPDEQIVDADGDFLIKHFYNGFRRDVPAEVYGAHCLGRTLNLKPGGDVDAPQNSSPLKKIHVPFTIDPIWQVVTFSQYLYRSLGFKIEDAEPILETGCLIRNPLTNHIERYTRQLFFPPPLLGSKPAYIYHEDCQWNIIGEYTTADVGNNFATHTLTGEKVQGGIGFFLGDTVRRSEYYLRAAAIKYQLVGALNRTYNGLMPIWLDGRIQQVTWAVGEPSGAYTQAGLNTEYSIAAPPYPERLRVQYAHYSLHHINQEDVQPPVPPGGKP